MNPHRISEEVLLAYVDGELDGAARSEVEAALQADPQLADQVARQRALRERLSAAYDPVLAEPIPQRLLAAAQTPAAPKKVVDLAAARSERDAARAERRPEAGWGWQQWGGMAACLAIGLFIGREMLAPPADLVLRDGRLVAQGPLDRMLTQMAAADSDAAAPNHVGLTFVSKSGDYCRTFSWGARGDASAGLACRSGSAWELRTLARNASASESTGPMRMAGSGLPEPVLRAVEAEIAGSPLDAQAERAALQSGWRKR
jgi:hypothetical protein